MGRKNKISTIDKLRRRNHVTVNGYPMCLKDEKTVHHLSIHCHFYYKVRCIVLYLFNMNWVMPRTMEDLFLERCLGSKGGQVRILRKLVSYTTVWKLWLEMNSRCSGIRVRASRRSLSLLFGLCQNGCLR